MMSMQELFADAAPRQSPVPQINEGESVDTKPFDLPAIRICPDLPINIQEDAQLALQKCAAVFEGFSNSLPKPFDPPPLLNCCSKRTPNPKAHQNPAGPIATVLWFVNGLKMGLPMFHWNTPSHRGPAGLTLC
jgi:hypothetical protein